MNRLSIFIFIFFIGLYKSQDLTDTLSIKTQDIGEVLISDKDYKKFEISYDLKQNTNTRYVTIPHNEIGLKFKNTHHKKGRISDVTLFLHKTEKERVLTNLEINFYTIDSLTGRPNKKINKEQIVFKPKNKNRSNIKINVLNFHIPFPENGVFVSIKWLPTKNGNKEVGPAVRMTAYSEPLTFSRYKNGKWSEKGNIFSKQDKYTNLMMGIDVYIKKRKNE